MVSRKIIEILLCIPALIIWLKAAYYIYKFTNSQKKNPLTKKIIVAVAGPFFLGKSKFLDADTKNYLWKFYFYSVFFLCYIFLIPLILALLTYLKVI